MSDDSLSGRLFLVDGNSLAYRAYFALPETIATSEGFPTNALYGFASMLIKVLTEFAPASVIVAWDARERTFRHEDYEDYKAGRKPMPDLLQQQWPYFEDLVAAFGLPSLKKEGYEADDILATLAEEAKRQGVRSVIVTGDRDMLQLVDDDISVMANTKGVSEVVVYTPQKVVERYGVTPDEVPDFIGLKGDSSDNIPGVPGVGEKTAAQLVQQFGSVENLYEHLAEAGSQKRQALLAEHEQAARLSKQLAQQVTDVPLEADVEALIGERGYAPPVTSLEEFFNRFEMASLARRVRELVGVDAAPQTAGFPLPKLVLEEGMGPLAVMLEKGETAVAAVPADKETAGLTGGPAVTTAAYAGGEAAVVASVDGDQWPALWRCAAHVIAHDAKSLPGFATAPADPAFDTAIAAYLIAPERVDRDLFRLMKVGEETLIEGPQAEARAATRAVLTWRLAEQQRRRLVELDLERLFREIELPLARILARMEAVGVKMDPYRLGEITARVRDRVDELTDRIHKLAGGPFTIGSPQQLGEVLFSRLGLPPVRKGKTGYSTDASVLKTLRDQHPIVAPVEEWRETTKLLNTYLDPLPQRLDPHTGRLHTTFNQTVASTGRLSSSNPNLQNIPVRGELGAEIRSCFVAEVGWRLVVADYSQIELRLLAFLAEEPALLESFRRGEDIHRATAAVVTGTPLQEVTKQQRDRAKATNFGIIYGLSAFGLSEQTGMSREEAQAFIDAYYARYPRVQEYRQEIIRKAAEEGFVTTVFGRRRPIPELRGHTVRERNLGERLAVNSVLQGSAADIIKVAMIRAEKDLAAQGSRTRLVLQVHDELIFEAPQDEVKAVAPLVREAMCDAYEVDPPLEVSIGVGDNWLEAK
jgi:DNA polymerase-1